MNLPGPVVSAQWLEANLDHVQVADVRWTMAGGPSRVEFVAGHIPGAVFVDLDADLSDPPGERGRHPLPSAEDFASARARLGFDGRPVVAYDDTGGSTAGRLWWMLDALGYPVAVLDGGLARWGGQIERGESHPVPAPVEFRPWPADRFVSVDEVLPAIADGAVLVDARSAERFAGEPNPIDPRPGHIPGAVSRPWEQNLTSQGRLASPDELRKGFEEIGVGEGTDLIASCGSGVTGCHLLLAGAVAGLGPGRLYTGSWSEWSASPDRPVETGPSLDR